MRRWLLRILFCLILGAVTTVAVAWSCAALLPQSAFISFTGFPLLFGEGRVETTSGYTRRFGYSLMTSNVYELKGDEYEFGNRVKVLAGWPCVAFAEDAEDDERESVLLDRFVEFNDRIIPLRVEAVGFSIDTLFYAAIWGGVFFGFTSAKRLIRIKRGRCPRCGYDLRGQQVGQVSDLSGFVRLSEPPSPPPAQRAGETSHGSESRATTSIGCPECGWNRPEAAASTAV